MDLGIAGRVAIITGASRGIGRVTAELLGAEGASLVLAARGAAELEKTVSGLQGREIPVVGVAVDITEPTSAKRLVDAALERFGAIDILVNNAGGSGGQQRSLQDFDERHWMDVYQLNVVSALRLTLACLPSMTQRGWGRVVNVSSTAARLPDPRFGPYGAAKAALLHVTRNLAQAYSKAGVCINAVLPGLTRTEGVLESYASAGQALGRSVEEIERRMLERQPIAADRPGEPAEVADTIAFLSSERASWITGSLLLVDGGTVQAIP